MFELLHNKVLEIVDVTDEEFERFTAYFKPKLLKKKRLLLEEGDICKYTAFVENGLLKSYSVDEKGIEHILQFACNGWWSADLYSFLSQQPTQMYIEAIEDSELLLISYDNWNEMLDTLPKYERFFRILLMNNLIATQKRLLNNFSETAEEKYIELTIESPDLIQRVPQHMIASYLGITKETLSRVRASIASKK